MGRYSVGKLFEAFDILEDEGREAFNRFVVREKMSSEDIERVLNKYNYIHNAEFKEKIDGIIENIKKKFDGGGSDFVSPF